MIDQDLCADTSVSLHRLASPLRCGVRVAVCEELENLLPVLIDTVQEEVLNLTFVRKCSGLRVSELLISYLLSINFHLQLQYLLLLIIIVCSEEVNELLISLLLVQVLAEEVLDHLSDLGLSFGLGLMYEALINCDFIGEKLLISL